MLVKKLVQHAMSNGVLHKAKIACRSGHATDGHWYCLIEVVKGRQRVGLPT